MEQHISLLQEELAQFSATSSTQEYNRGGTREVQVRYNVQWGQELEEEEEEDDQLLALHRCSSEESLLDQQSSSRNKKSVVSVWK